MSRKHLMYGTPTYRSWSAMLTRCTNQRNHKYPEYGGRGIRVCDRWRDFSAFLLDLGPRPEGTSLGRIDNDGNYEPGNCAWQSITSQARNKRSTAVFDYQGIVATIPEHCERMGLKASTVRSRVYTYGWPINKAFEEPPRSWGGNRKKSNLTTTA